MRLAAVRGLFAGFHILSAVQLLPTAVLHILLPRSPYPDDLADGGGGGVGDLQDMLPIGVLPHAHPLRFEGEGVLWEPHELLNAVLMSFVSWRVWW